jgi:hypothetical protein
MKAATRLAILRLHDADDGRLSFFNSRQIDARQLVFALRQVLAAERLEQGSAGSARHRRSRRRRAHRSAAGLRGRASWHKGHARRLDAL